MSSQSGRVSLQEEPAAAPLRVTVLCGFVGAGKSRVLCEALAYRPAGPVAMLMHDRGEASGESMAGLGGGIEVFRLGEALAELVQDCVGCSLRESLTEAMTALARMRRFSRLVIECSGLAEPMMVADVFNEAWADGNGAMRQFTEELHIYGLSKRKEEARKILVVNGDDIPIMPMSWDDIILPPGFVVSIRRNVDMFFKSEDRYRCLGLPYRRGLLFAGPPGCGKTATLKALAYHSDAQVITVLGNAGVEDRDIENALRLAATHRRAIVLLEDMDKLVRAKHVSLLNVLNLLDGFRALNGVMIIATANEPEELDPALLLRPSRFDRVWTFPLPRTKSA